MKIFSAMLSDFKKKKKVYIGGWVRVELPVLVEILGYHYIHDQHFLRMVQI